MIQFKARMSLSRIIVSGANPSVTSTCRALLIVAAFLCATRLIDNLLLPSQ
jgi:pantothenate synthetase